MKWHIQKVQFCGLVWVQIEKYIIFLMTTIPNLPANLVTLLQKVSESRIGSQIFQLQRDRYKIHGTNINCLTPEKVLQTYIIIKKKQIIAQKRFYYERVNPANCSWFQNQLRIFIWILFSYMLVNKKEVQQMVKFDVIQKTQDDWKFFSEIFYDRDPIVFEFQGMLMVKRKSSKWEKEQIGMLQKIVKQHILLSLRIKSMRNKWNTIARELYSMSKKKYIKTPKQCRQRWLNYLDPSKVHSPWNLQQDLMLLESIKNYGKRWAYTVRKLLKKRTEHMVKNRFNSLINNEKKRIGNKSETELMNSAIDYIKMIIKEGGGVLNKIEYDFSGDDSESESSQMEDQSSQMSEIVNKKTKRQSAAKCSKPSQLQPDKSTQKTIPPVQPEIEHEVQVLPSPKISQKLFVEQSPKPQFFSIQLQEPIKNFNPFDEEELSHDIMMFEPRFFCDSQNQYEAMAFHEQ